jgi:segregation and condensation protein A
LTYQIKLPEFEGPFDLLLFFIERDELDIYDIPIADITDEFLIYLQARESLDLDVASEFILVAATLMRIKAKMLLPRKEIDAEGNEIDPRQELVERLLEYKRYKDIMSELRDLEQTQASKWQRGNIINEIQQIANQAMADAELENLSLFSLLKAYESAMFEFKYREAKTIHTVVRYTYTIEQSRDYVLGAFDVDGRMAFAQVFTGCENRLHAIFRFLAILELLQMEEIALVSIDGFNNFEIQKVELSLLEEEE